MKFYSKYFFNFIIAVYIISSLIALIYGTISFLFACWGVHTYLECFPLQVREIFLNGFLPLLFIILSLLIIMLQQKKNVKLGYLFIPLLIISPILNGTIIKYSMWFDVNWFLSISSISGTGFLMQAFFTLAIIVLFLISIIPFYVLGRLVVHEVRGVK